jgi:hypothetical protein
VPLPLDPAVAKHMVVSGDYAVPVSRIVFSATVRRAEAADLPARLSAGRDVYWAPDWEAGLARGGGASPEPANPARSRP